MGSTYHDNSISYERGLPMPEELPSVDQPLIPPMLQGSFGISDSVFHQQQSARDPSGHSYLPSGARPEYSHQMYRPPLAQEPTPAHPGGPHQPYAPYAYDQSLRMSHLPYGQHPQAPQRPQQHPSMSPLQHPGPYPYNPTVATHDRDALLGHGPPPPHIVGPPPHMARGPPPQYHNPMDGRDPYASQRFPQVMDPHDMKDPSKGNKRPGEPDMDQGRPDMEQARALKRPRLVWTPQLHKRFVDAVGHLGIKNSVPKTIMQLMNVEGLTRENVASHLQKYRLYLKRLGNGDGSAADGGSELAEEGDDDANVAGSTQSNQEGTSAGATAQSNDQEKSSKPAAKKGGKASKDAKTAAGK